jgi:hypothetical protein
MLDGPVSELLAALTDRTLRGRELRENSPFAGLIEPTERDQVLAAWQEHDQSSSP